jgi:hypothetical protein
MGDEWTWILVELGTLSHSLYVDSTNCYLVKEKNEMNLGYLLLSASAVSLMVVLLLTVLRKSERQRISNMSVKNFGPDKRDTIFMAWAVVVGLTIYSLGDKAITIPGVPVPYGLLWAWINPLYWGGEVYKWIILGIQLGVMIPQYWLAKKGKLNWHMLHLMLFTTIYFRLMGVFQEVTAVIFQPFATLNPAASLLLLLQKYPFWTIIPNLADPHYQCSILGQCIDYTVNRNIWFTGALNPDIATHLVIVFWLIAPMYVWFKKRQNKEYNESRFWMKMMLPLSAIMMFGFVVIMFFGCCADYHWFV